MVSTRDVDTREDAKERNEFKPKEAFYNAAHMRRRSHGHAPPPHRTPLWQAQPMKIHMQACELDLVKGGFESGLIPTVSEADALRAHAALLPHSLHGISVLLHPIHKDS